MLSVILSVKDNTVICLTLNKTLWFEVLCLTKHLYSNNNKTK